MNPRYRQGVLTESGLVEKLCSNNEVVRHRYSERGSDLLESTVLFFGRLSIALFDPPYGQ
jgi:hypothetical protein